MNPKEIHERINEFCRIREEAGNDEPALLEVALFIEDVFGLVLSDDEICEKNLGTYRNLERFVLNKMNSPCSKLQGITSARDTRR